MKKFIKKTLAVMLAIVMVAGIFTCSAAAYEKKYEDYGSYVLLGDSVASGWSDVETRETRFVRVEGSYGAFVADDLGVEYHPMACIGFRTVEMRYIFEDDYEPDRFLFYSIDDEEMAWRIPLIREAVANAGLVTLNVGGNDWGSFLGWHVFEEMDKFQDKNPEFMAKAEELLTNAGVEANTMASLIDLASMCGVLPDLVSILPGALKLGFSRFVENWNYVIEDIYALNPDVTLVVIGMFDNMVQDQETADSNEAALIKLNLSQAIIDYANKPMAEGAEKYGYTFIDPVGTICEQNHPSVEGHRYIADLILDSLPDANFPYKDVDRSAKEYKSIEYMLQNGIIPGLSATEFGYNKPLTKGQIAEATYNFTGVEGLVDVKDPDAKASYTQAVIASYKMVSNSGASFTRVIKALMLAIKMIVNNGLLNVNRSVTRAEAAVIIKTFIDLL